MFFSKSIIYFWKKQKIFNLWNFIFASVSCISNKNRNIKPLEITIKLEIPANAEIQMLSRSIIHRTMEIQQTKIIRCYNCGNETKQLLVYNHISYIMYDETRIDGKNEKLNNSFHYLSYKCSTCSGLNIIGGFENEIDIELDNFKRLFPVGPNLRMPDHQLLERIQPIPDEIIKIYEEIWFLRKQVPNAFANQIRKCLEMICNDNGAKGITLNDKLRDLKNKGLLPGTNEELVKIIREVGNLGSHASGQDLDIWDVELLDEFFKTVIDYIYVIPMKMKRLNQRLSSK